MSSPARTATSATSASSSSKPTGPAPPMRRCRRWPPPSPARFATWIRPESRRPLQRAARTAELAGYPQSRLTPLLREVDYGEYEGVTSTDIRAKNPGWQLYRDGCPGGETPAQVYARATEFIRLCETIDGRVLAFGHGHILRAVAASWARLDITAAAGFQLDVATLSRLRDDPEHGRLIAMWNAP